MCKSHIRTAMAEALSTARLVQRWVKAVVTTLWEPGARVRGDWDVPRAEQGQPHQCSIEAGSSASTHLLPIITIAAPSDSPATSIGLLALSGRHSEHYIFLNGTLLHPTAISFQKACSMDTTPCSVSAYLPSPCWDSWQPLMGVLFHSTSPCPPVLAGLSVAVPTLLMRLCPCTR